ncbi:MAG: hypothetical protein KBD55_02410 [Candidatus Pacebacteria bacterium]|nr:hypothetical protein [Candidatus Paceibacterota bacterium]
MNRNFVKFAIATLVVAFALLSAACGGSPTSPSATQTPVTNVTPVSTTLKSVAGITDAFTGAPVNGSIQVSGISVPVSGGTATIDAAVGTSIRVEANGYFPYDTNWYSRTGFELFPIRNGNSIAKAEQMLYAVDAGNLGNGSAHDLQRLAPGATISISAIGMPLEDLAKAAALIQSRTGFPTQIGGQGSVKIEVVEGPTTNDATGSAALAQAQILEFDANGYVSRSRITVRDLSWVGKYFASTMFFHEILHTLGFAHHEGVGVMSMTWFNSQDLSPEESDIVAMALKLKLKTKRVHDDRSVAQFSSTASVDAIALGLLCGGLTPPPIR